MFDLTGLLTTIAGSSATLAAIIGGFIASKLIALNTERAEIMVRIQEIDEEITFTQKKIDEMRQSLVEDDALDFITEHIDELIDGTSLDVLFSQLERPPELPIEVEELEPYWNKAIDVIRRMAEFTTSNDCRLNDDGIPVGFGVGLSAFEYQICKSAVDAICNRQESPSAKAKPRTGFFLPSWEITMPKIEMPRFKSIWYEKAKNNMQGDGKHLEWLQIQKRQLEARQRALRTPRGVIGGLLVFFMVVLMGVLAPLVSVPYVVEDYQTMLRAKRSYVALFLFVLAAVFLYFVDLARWKEPKLVTREE